MTFKNNLKDFSSSVIIIFAVPLFFLSMFRFMPNDILNNNGRVLVNEVRS